MADKKKGFFAEFKEFISRGNVVDMAVGVVVGGAFTSIVNSLAKGIILPAVGALFGGINFSELKFVIKAADEAAGTPEAAILYGEFIQNIVNFLLVSLVVFCFVRAINAFRRRMEEAKKAEEEAAKPAEPATPPPPPPTPEDILLLREIRDMLKENEKK